MNAAGGTPAGGRGSAGAAGAAPPDGAANGAPAGAGMSRETRRGLRRARALIVIASAILVVSILATWIRAQIIDTDGWTQTSVQMLENEKVREFVAADLS